MEAIEADEYKLRDYGRINIIFGKNGSGKSTLLKKLEGYLRSNSNYGNVKYITPERGGILTYNPNIELNISDNPQWLPDTRRKNRLENFREQSVAQLRNLELLFLRELENRPELRQDINYKFLTYFNKINSLLDNIELRQHGSSFKIYQRLSDQEIGPESISSGEAELISLGIECLVFDKECNIGKTNILFLDEPDVHIHPDLQAKLMHFLKELVDTEKFIVVIATHSTAILGALENYEHVNFEFMKKGQKSFAFKKVLKEYKSIIPIFGAHPLSNIYCSMPIFLVEGEDDVWIWQKAIRTSEGLLKIFPCSVDGLDGMPRYEKMVNEIINSIYDIDSVMAYSLRDRDDVPEANNLDDYGKYDKIQRFMLNCRCAENLFLSDEVLNKADTHWLKVINDIDEWLKSNANHQVYSIMKQFKEGGYDRKKFKDIKEVINILVGLITKKPWQIAVGQEIGELVKNKQPSDVSKEHSLANYLGNDLTNWLCCFNPYVTAD